MTNQFYRLTKKYLIYHCQRNSSDFYLKRFCNFLKHGRCYQFVDFCSLFEIISYEVPGIWNGPNILLGSFKQFGCQLRHSFRVGGFQLGSFLDDLRNLLGKITAVFDEILQFVKSRVAVFWECPVEHQPRPPGGLFLCRHLPRAWCGNVGNVTGPALFHTTFQCLVISIKRNLRFLIIFLPVKISEPRVVLGKW